jgi:hypothetical protein
MSVRCASSLGRPSERHCIPEAAIQEPAAISRIDGMRSGGFWINGEPRGSLAASRPNRTFSLNELVSAYHQLYGAPWPAFSDRRPLTNGLSRA